MVSGLIAVWRIAINAGTRAVLLRTVFLSGLVVLYHWGHAQGVIHGTILDRTNKPLPGANVLLLHATDSSLAKGMVAGEQGTWAFQNVKPGSYVLTFSATGFEKVYSPVLSVSDKERKDMGTQVLSEANKHLEKVTVTATARK